MIRDGIINDIVLVCVGLRNQKHEKTTGVEGDKLLPRTVFCYSKQ